MDKKVTSVTDQVQLFPIEDQSDYIEEFIRPEYDLSMDSTITSSFPAYEYYLMSTDHSGYTVTCFLSDLKLFTRFIGEDTPLGRIQPKDITAWLNFLKLGSNRTPAPKTMARRVTFLKNYFAWLSEDEVLKDNPAASIVLTRPLPPLPEMLSDEEVDRLVVAASLDNRCHCLVTLLLNAGLKKEEVKAIHITHIDVTNPSLPVVSVQFSDRSKQHRERKLALPSEFTEIYKRYIFEYHPKEFLFECTDRNLNYILAKAVTQSGIEKKVTLQLLRDTYAVRQIRSGVTFEALRERLGLSEEAWRESQEKYKKLAFS